MASEEPKIPTVAAEEIDLSTVRAVLIVPGLTVHKKNKLFGPAEPDKNCEVNVNYETRSLQASVNITDKKRKVTKYMYKVNKLPGDIDPGKCKTEFKKEQVILSLVKPEEYSWAVQLSKSGLEQDPDA